MDNLLRKEAAARRSLNELQAERQRLDEACTAALNLLNDRKREAYVMGFTGNIMRDADGNRVNAVPTPALPTILKVICQHCQRYTVVPQAALKEHFK